MRRFALLLLSVLLLPGCPLRRPTSELASVNGEAVTAADLRRAFKERHGGHEKFLGGENEARQFLNVVIDWRLLIQEAYDLGLQDMPEIQKATNEYRERKSVEYLVKKEVDDKAKPTPEEVKAVWDKSMYDFYQTWQIVVDTREEAGSVRSMLEEGADFDQLARACSQAESRIYGGQLAPVGWGMMDEAWEDAVFSLKPGEFSQPIHGHQGWEVVWFDLRIPTIRPELKEVSNKIEAVLQKRKIDRRTKELSDELWAKYHVTLPDVDRAPRALARLLAEKPETVLASWDGGVLTLKDLATDVDFRFLAMMPQGRAADMLDAQIHAAINDPLIHLEATARKISVVPEVADMARRFQEDQMEGALYDRHILKDVNVTDEEARKYYEEHKAELVTPEKRRVSHIVVGTEEEAKDVRKQIAEGESFEKLGKERSKDVQSAQSGGDLGWITKKDTPKDLEPVLKLQEGDVSEPLKSQYGWHIIKVTAIVPERPKEFDEAKADIRAKILLKKQQEKRSYWVKKLREAAEVKINSRGIQQFVKDSMMKEPPPATHRP